MNTKACRRWGVVAILALGGLIPYAKADLFSVTDVDGDPNIFACDLTAIQNDVKISGANVHTFNYKDENAGAQPPASAGIPVQVIRVKVGDVILCRFKNNLSAESASIHWHGIELDNDSDGTPVTQDAVLPGQSYTYRFQTFRPGVFWFHSHMLPGNTLFGGMYGVIIIENPIEASLRASGVLPAESDTHTLALSDIDFDSDGKVGKSFGGGTKTLNELIELCHLYGIGDPSGDMLACNASATPGATVLVNGQKPDAGAQTPKFVVPSGKKIRLRLLNESISRHFRLKLLNSGDNKLYRIGGQGGLLDNIILEGGTKGTLDTKYDLGEIVIGSGERADVIIVPSGNQGDIIQLVGNPLPVPFKISQSLPANYPVAFFQISGTSADVPPTVGAPILAGTAEDVENIKTGGVITPLVDPAPFGGSSDETIHLTTAKPTGPVPYANNQPGVDQYAAVLDSNIGNGDWLVVPQPPVARYAHVGDVLELTVRNDTDAVHPYHLHGFSMQPLRFVDNISGTTLYTFDYDEFLDTIDVYAGQSYVFRVRLDDRAKICDLSPDVPANPGPVLAPCSPAACGGAVGRWLFHCHIVNHGSLGMIGELTVLPTPDSPPEIFCSTNIVVGNDPGLCSAVVNYAVSASDDCGVASLVSSPPSGSVFPVGTTTVTAIATDTTGHVTTCTFTVTVQDLESPHITCPANIVVCNDPGLCSAKVSFTVTATDNCAIQSVISTPPSGSVFPKGTNTVTSVATDTSGNISSCSFTIIVNDCEPPKVTSSVSTATLWSPNHDLVNVGFTATATDNCPGPIAINVQVFSDESENAKGDGHFSPDAKNIAPGTLRLRSERFGDDNGRVYLIVTTATDTSGNKGHSCATVLVPHDQSAASIASANAQGAAAKAFCEANSGGVPPGFVLIGIGPVDGPKQ